MSAAHHPTVARAALLSNLPNVDELVAELAVMKLNISVAIDAINIEIVAACLSDEPRTLETGILTRSTPSTAEEAAKRVATAGIVLAEEWKCYGGT